MYIIDKTSFDNRLERVEDNTVKPNRLVRVFQDVHLGNGHEGLSKIASKVGIKVNKLDLGEYVVFINPAKSAMKMFAPGNIVAYMKLPDGMTIDMRVIAMLPRFFNGGKINYPAALKEKLMKEFPQAQATLM